MQGSLPACAALAKRKLSASNVRPLLGLSSANPTFWRPGAQLLPSCAQVALMYDRQLASEQSANLSKPRPRAVQDARSRRSDASRWSHRNRFTSYNLHHGHANYSRAGTLCTYCANALQCFQNAVQALLVTQNVELAVGMGAKAVCMSYVVFRAAAVVSAMQLKSKISIAYPKFAK